MSVATETDVVEVQAHIEAPPEEVFPYLIEPERMMRWMGTEAELDPRPGGVFNVNVTGRDRALGEYLEVSPPERVRFTWGWEGNDSGVGPGETEVEITLRPDGDGSLVVLRHSGLPKATRDSHAEGWEHYMERLRIAGAGGEAGHDSFQDEPSEDM